MSMSEQAPRQADRKPLFRIVAAGSVAAVLLGSSFYGAQAGSASGYGDTDGDSSGKTAGIVAGTVIGVYLLANAIGGSASGSDADSNTEDKEKSAKAGKVEQVRIVPSQTQLDSGDTAILNVQARYQGSKTWQTVTESANVRLQSGGLTQVDGTKNAFAVPYGAKTASGPATVEATFGGQSVTAQLHVN